MARGGSRKRRWAVEQTLADALARRGVLVAALPPPPDDVEIGGVAAAWLQRLDGLLLQGGDDLSGASVALCTSRRDRFELALLTEAMARRVPVLGICRGLQLINIAMGGTLRRCEVDLVSGSGVHSDPQRYDAHHHRVHLERDGRLSALYGMRFAQVTSMHDLAPDRLGDGLRVESWCSVDHSIEAVSAAASSLVLGVQWHPEFNSPTMLPSQPLWTEFLRAVEAA
jgi:putative glutamine amidotransferase